MDWLKEDPFNKQQQQLFGRILWAANSPQKGEVDIGLV
jgi:hypothetical protein